MSDSGSFGFLFIVFDNSFNDAKSNIASTWSESVGFMINAFMSISMSSNVSWNTDFKANITLAICSCDISDAPSHNVSFAPNAINEISVFDIFLGLRTV